jgi:cytochrome c-type biogenesis protein CcmF
MTIGIIVSSVYDMEGEATLLPGESATFGQYNITYDQAHYDTSATRITLTADLSLYKNGRYIGVLSPGTSLGIADESPVGEVAIRSTFFEDLYIMPVDWQQVALADNTQTIQVSLIARLNPFIMWIWIGGIILLLGGLIAFWPSMRLPQRAGNNIETDAGGQSGQEDEAPAISHRD